MKTAHCTSILARLALSCALPLVLGLSGCATPQQRLTEAALSGDAKAFDDTLREPLPDINAQAALERAQPACPDMTLLNPLQAAACAGRDDMVRKLLSRKADVNASAPGKFTPLMLALIYKHDEAARMLLEAGARPNEASDHGDTALMFASRDGNKAMAEQLLKAGASPLTKNKEGRSVLLVCADPGLARMLVALGANPLDRALNGETGLHIAARNGRPAMARYFIEQGVDVSLRAKNGLTALDMARGKTPGAPPAANAAANAAADAVADPAAISVGRAGRAAALPQGMGKQQAAPAGSPEVAKIIEERLGQLLEEEQAAGDKAARAGRAAEALTLYAKALTRAETLGGKAEESLRLLIVRYAASLPQPPAMPEKAREHLVRGQYLLSKGQSVSAVEREMREAQRLAPWWPEGYYNLGILQFGQNKYDEAMANLRLFMAAAPGDPRVRNAQDKIFEINMAKEQAEKVQAMQGSWKSDSGTAYSVSVAGEKMTITGAGRTFTLSLKNTILEGSVEGGAGSGSHGCAFPSQMHPVTGTFDADARVIDLEFLWSTYTEHYHCVDMWGFPSNCCLLCDTVCDASTVSGTTKLNVRLSAEQQ